MINEATVTVSNLVCVTYKANNFVTPYHFVGKTEEEARKQLQDFLDKKQEVNVNEDGEEKDNAIQAGIGRGVANTGKVWMIHHKEEKRARVLPSEVDNYSKLGYVPGGPKTAFKKW